MERLSDRLIEDGLKPRVAKVRDPDMHRLFHGIAFEVLKRHAPGLTDVTRNAIAVQIALRCERASRRDKAA